MECAISTRVQTRGGGGCRGDRAMEVGDEMAKHKTFEKTVRLVDTFVMKARHRCMHQSRSSHNAPLRLRLRVVNTRQRCPHTARRAVSYNRVFAVPPSPHNSV